MLGKRWDFVLFGAGNGGGTVDVDGGKVAEERAVRRVRTMGCSS